MSGKRKFGLEAVLRVRQRTEEAARQELLRALAEVSRHEAILGRLGETLSRENAAAGAAVAAGSPQLPSTYRQQVGQCRLAQVQHGRELSQAAVELSQRRQELLDALKQRKAISRLKERWQQRRKDALARRNGAELDDLHRMFAAANELTLCEVSP